MFDLTTLLRPNIARLVPYSSARDEFKGKSDIFLDANENGFGSPLERDFNRYPDPQQTAVKARLSELKGVAANRIFVGNGSDEAIDLLYRCFCEPNKDQALVCPPTYGMYEVSANINAVELIKVPLQSDFQLDLPAIWNAITPTTKLIFVCSPNNPTGNDLRAADLVALLQGFKGLVVVDEAYIDFSDAPSWTKRLADFPNLVVLQTLSKAWGLAGLRLGLAFASPEIITIFNKVKPPYNVNAISQEWALQALAQADRVGEWIATIRRERQALISALQGLSFVEKIYPSDANFILIQLENARHVYEYLLEQGIVVRDRSNVPLCAGCLRVTIGTPEENARLLEALKIFKI